MAKVQKEWLVKLREERSISQAVKLAGPFVLTLEATLNLISQLAEQIKFFPSQGVDSDQDHWRE